MPDNCRDSFLCLVTILLASFSMSVLSICRALFLVEASSTIPAMKPYLHFPLFLATLSRYRIAYPRISICLINLIGSSKCRYLALLIFVLGVLLLHVSWYLPLLLFVVLGVLLLHLRWYLTLLLFDIIIWHDSSLPRTRVSTALSHEAECS